MGAYDYMLKDHLGNVRTVLTDEWKEDIYLAGFEEENQGLEDQLFLNYNQYGSTIVQKPECFDGNAGNNKVLKLSKNKENHTVLGTGKVLKVMAGDKVNINTKAWFHPDENHGASGDEAVEILQALVTQFFAGGIQATGAKGSVSLSTLQNSVGTQISNFLSTQHNGNADEGAFLNWIFLDDEQLKWQQQTSGFVSIIPAMFENQTAGACNEQAELIQANQGNGIDITKNGYLYIYLSNTNTQYPVYFDDLHILHNRGALLEETAYYPFGLTMSGISSKAANIQKNKEQTFQNQRFDDELDLNWVQFKWRNHDPQIGRFIEIDPLSEKYVYNSTYAFSENKVIAHVELEGLEAVEAWQTIVKEKNGCDYTHYTSMKIDANEAREVFGHQGTLTHYLTIGIDGTFIQFDVFVGQTSNNGWKLPQILIFGSSKFDGGLGSPIDYSRPVTVMDFGSNEELGLILDVLGAIPTSKGMDTDIGKYLRDNYKTPLDVLNKITKKLEPNEEYCTVCKEKRHSSDGNNLPFIRTDSKGNPIDTVFPPNSKPPNLDNPSEIVKPVIPDPKKKMYPGSAGQVGGKIKFD